MLNIAPLLAFGFGNLAMLGWLAAAATPLLIHLWSRRRHREAPWAAMQFLLAALRKNSRRIQLRQWLLLAVRTLILVVVAVAVAEPHNETFGPGPAGVPAHRVIVLDTSYSMAYVDEGVGRLSQAKRLAARIVEESGPKDAFTLIAHSGSPRQVFGRKLIDRSAVTAQIMAVSQSHEPANLNDTLNLVAEALKLTANEQQRLPRQEVLFFTDLQRATWQPYETESARLRDQFDKLTSSASLRIVDVGRQRSPNTAVTGLRISEPFVTVAAEATFSITVHEYSDQPRVDCSIELLVDDRIVAEQRADVPARGDVTVNFTHRFRDIGTHTVATRVRGDSLEIDNTRWLAVPVVERLNVLCVGGTLADVTYIADALNPDHAEDSSIRPVTISEGEFAETNLTPFACVFLSNVEQLTSKEARRLTQFVAQGGGLAVFLGDRISATSYNATAALDTGQSGGPLLPARLGDVISDTQFGIDPLGYQHPIVAPFRGRERAGLLTTPLNRYFRLEPLTGGTRPEFAAATRNGDPLIVTTEAGRGRTVLIATAGTLSSIDASSGEPWTAWPAWPSFLPIVREILSYSMGGNQGLWQSLVGQPLFISDLPGAQPNAMTITRPNGEIALLRDADSADVPEWNFGETELSGIYTVNRPKSAEPLHFAVNVDTRESDLTRGTPGELPPDIRVETDIGTQFSSAHDGYASRDRWQSSLLWSALALTFLELGLAWHLGRGAA